MDAGTARIQVDEYNGIFKMFCAKNAPATLRF